MRYSNVKMIALDLDGTLLTSEKELTKETVKTLREAMEQGIIVLPATGRPESGLPKDMLEALDMQYALTANSARVLDMKEKKVIYENLVPYEIAEKVLDIFDKYDTLIEVYYDGVGYADRKKLDRIDDFFIKKPMGNYVRTTRQPVEDVRAMFTEKKKPSDKVQAVFRTVEEKKQALAEIEQANLEIEVSDALVNNLEINSKGVNKGKGLIRLGEMLGIKREEIMAFGDGANDVEMLKEVGIGVAMDNACDRVKEVADLITTSNDEDGVAFAIKKYVLE